MRGLRVMMPARHSPVACGVASGFAPAQPDRGGDLLQQFLAVERLGEEAEHAALRRRDGFRYGSVRGQNDHRHRRMLAMDRIEQCEAVDARHLEVGDHGGRTLDRQRRERGFAAVGGAHPVAGRSQPQADQLEQIGVIVDQKDVARMGHR